MWLHLVFLELSRLPGAASLPAWFTKPCWQLESHEPCTPKELLQPLGRTVGKHLSMETHPQNHPWVTQMKNALFPVGFCFA